MLSSEASEPTPLRAMTTFEALVTEIEPPLRAALVACYGTEEGREATAEALAYAWEHWQRVMSIDRPVGYLFRVAQSRSRHRAAAPSGTAEVTQTSSQNGVPQDGYETAVTFSGQNIDEKITSVPEPPGSAKSFTTDDRFVDGQFYIYTPGPGDVLEWLHDTSSSQDAASMQFPDPRSLYRAISAAAQLTVEGTTTMNGENVTHLVAANPSAINSSALGNLAAGGTLASFEVWVEGNLVQRIVLTTSQTNQVCPFSPLSKAQAKLSEGKVGVEIPVSAIEAAQFGGDCGPQTTTSKVTVAFAGLGAPQSVTAPANPVDYAGKG